MLTQCAVGTGSREDGVGWWWWGEQQPIKARRHTNTHTKAPTYELPLLLHQRGCHLTSDRVYGMLAILASDKSETLGHHARGTSLLLSITHTHTQRLHPRWGYARTRGHISKGVRIVRSMLHPCQTRSQCWIITRGPSHPPPPQPSHTTGLLASHLTPSRTHTLTHSLSRCRL